MKYIFNIFVFAHQRPYDITMTFPLTLEARVLRFREGEWSISGPYLQQSDGYWRYIDVDPDDPIVAIQTEDDTGVISTLFGHRADSLMYLNGFSRFPPKVGETGTGIIARGGKLAPGESDIGWKLVYLDL